jgi:hypothetical protein
MDDKSNMRVGRLHTIGRVASELGRLYRQTRRGQVDVNEAQQNGDNARHAAPMPRSRQSRAARDGPRDARRWCAEARDHSSSNLMAGLETRIAKLEAARGDRDDVDAAVLWSLPFWSRLSAALAVENFRELLQGWELPRRIAAALREAERRDDAELRAYADRWRAILWPGGEAIDLGSVEVLDDIRGRLRAVLIYDRGGLAVQCRAGQGKMSRRDIRPAHLVSSGDGRPRQSRHAGLMSPRQHVKVCEKWKCVETHEGGVSDLAIEISGCSAKPEWAR